MLGSASASWSGADGDGDDDDDAASACVAAAGITGEADNRGRMVDGNKRRRGRLTMLEDDR